MPAASCLGPFLTLGDDGRGPLNDHVPDLDARAENGHVTHPHTSDTLWSGSVLKVNTTRLKSELWLLLVAIFVHYILY